MISSDNYHAMHESTTTSSARLRIYESGGTDTKSIAGRIPMQICEVSFLQKCTFCANTCAQQRHGWHIDAAYLASSLSAVARDRSLQRHVRTSCFKTACRTMWPTTACLSCSIWALLRPPAVATDSAPRVDALYVSTNDTLNICKSRGILAW